MRQDAFLKIVEKLFPSVRGRTVLRQSRTWTALPRRAPPTCRSGSEARRRLPCWASTRGDRSSGARSSRWPRSSPRARRRCRGRSGSSCRRRTKYVTKWKRTRFCPVSPPPDGLLARVQPGHGDAKGLLQGEAVGLQSLLRLRAGGGNGQSRGEGNQSQDLHVEFFL